VLIEEVFHLSTELIKQFLEAGVHFGHKTSRWNPKMKKFIFGERNGIYIIDLEKTLECFNKARDFLHEITAKGEAVLFVGTKKQAQDVVTREAIRCGMYYVTERWAGGMLTNFFTIKKSINRLKDIERMKEDGTYEKLTKKEIAGIEKELEKLKKSFSGIAAMERLPSAIFIVDTTKEETAVREARKLSIPVIGLVDTNSNPDLVDYPIPGNDDATRSINIVTTLIAEAIIEGRKKFLSYLSQEGVKITKEKQEEPFVAAAAEGEVGVEEIEEIAEKEEDSTKEEVKAPRKIRQRSTEDRKKMKKRT